MFVDFRCGFRAVDLKFMSELTLFWIYLGIYLLWNAGLCF
jgi:hypothetical protein